MRTFKAYSGLEKGLEKLVICKIYFRDEDRMDTKQLITVAHLQAFKEELIFDLKNILRYNSKEPDKHWMKSREVRKLLNVSPGTLQTLRKQKTIAFMKIGGTIYYDREEIYKMFERNKSKAIQ